MAKFFMVSAPLVAILLISTIILPYVQSACFFAFDCLDRSANVTHQSGEVWETEDCHRCSCWPRKIHLKTCLEVDDGPTLNDDYAFNPKFRKSSVMTVRLISNSQKRKPQRTREVVVPMEDAGSFTCPQLPSPEKDLDRIFAPNLVPVKYVVEANQMGCCTM